MSDYLLSICIPTYNRANELNISLAVILLAVEKYQDIIEVIVSDNASTDNTTEIIEAYKSRFPFLIVNKNITNLGANRNFFLLSDQYARGKYFWLIGDDDVIDRNLIDKIIELLIKNKDLVFIGLNFRISTPDKIVTIPAPIDQSKIVVTRMSSLINEQCRIENILATFISCNIILRERFSGFDKSIFSDNSWDDYKSLFPHTHIITSVVKPYEKVIYISTPTITVLCHDKEWDNKLSRIYLYFITDVYKYYIYSGYSKEDIRNTKIVIINSGIRFLFYRNVSIRDKLYFMKFAIFDKQFSISLFSLFKKALHKLHAK